MGCAGALKSSFVLVWMMGPNQNQHWINQQLISTSQQRSLLPMADSLELEVFESIHIVLCISFCKFKNLILLFEFFNWGNPPSQRLGFELSRKVFSNRGEKKLSVFRHSRVGSSRCIASGGRSTGGGVGHNSGIDRFIINIARPQRLRLRLRRDGRQ